MKNYLVILLLSFLFIGTAFAQEKTSMRVKDLDKNIEKYIKKNYETYEITEAYAYNLSYLMILQSGNETDKLVFNEDGDFLYKMTEALEEKVALQPKQTLALDDVPKGISKYIKKNLETYTVNEAYRYDLVYVTKIVKAGEEIELLFNDEGNFVRKLEAAVK